MSNKLKQSLQKKEEKPKVWCLSQEDWDQLGAALVAADKIFQKAEPVTPEQWVEWTSEFSEGQGFPSIIYHDKPIIIRPLMALIPFK